jgi:hypothetical protein
MTREQVETLRVGDVVIWAHPDWENDQGYNWARRENLDQLTEYTITDMESDTFRFKVSPHGTSNFWHDYEAFEIVGSIAPELRPEPLRFPTNTSQRITDTEGLREGQRVRLVEVPIGSWVERDGLIVGNIYTISCLDESSFKVSPPGPNNYWVESPYFTLVESPVDDWISEVIDREFKIGDKVYVRHLDDMPEHEDSNWAMSAKLALNIEYTIDRLSPYRMNERSGDLQCCWIHLKEQVGSWVSHPSRFMFASEGIKITKGTKSMPQVISTCEISVIDKQIFQAIANNKKKDVYIYDMKGNYFTHPADKIDGIHFYFNSADAMYYNRDVGSPVPKYNSTERTVIRSCESSDVESTIQLLKVNLLRSTANALFLAGDFLTPISDPTEESKRIDYLIYIAYNYFGVVSINLTEGASTLLGYSLSKAQKKLEVERIKRVESQQRSIAETEQHLIRKHRELSDLLNTRYIEEDYEECTIIENIKKLPDIESVNFTIGSRSTIIVKTGLLVVHLPHGDIPSGSITITINVDNLEVKVVGEYRESQFHPHYGNNPCWGGFDSMIQKLLATNAFDILVDMIMKWHAAYDGSGIILSWGQLLKQKEIGILIDEGYYMSGESANE